MQMAGTDLHCTMHLSVYRFVDVFCLVPEIAKGFELSPRIMEQIAFI
jgi:hypothetical protein